MKISRMTIDEAYSISDAGGLLYSRTDCYLSLNISEIRASNIRSNAVLMQSMILPMGLSNLGVDDVEGGGLIKVTANSLLVSIISS